MAAVSTVLSLMAGAAVMNEGRKASNLQAQKMDEQANKQELALSEQKAAMVEQEAKSKVASDLSQKKQRQKALRAEQTGRSSTILTDSLGGGVSNTAPAQASQKTLLGV